LRPLWRYTENRRRFCNTSLSTSQQVQDHKHKKIEYRTRSEIRRAQREMPGGA
jgi:hypothetical protein